MPDIVFQYGGVYGDEVYEGLSLETVFRVLDFLASDEWNEQASESLSFMVKQGYFDAVDMERRLQWWRDYPDSCVV